MIHNVIIIKITRNPKNYTVSRIIISEKEENKECELSVVKVMTP